MKMNRILVAAGVIFRWIAILWRDDTISRGFFSVVVERCLPKHFGRYY